MISNFNLGINLNNFDIYNIAVPHVTTVAAPSTPGPPVNHQMGVANTMSHGTVSANQQQGGGIGQPTNASPRPSILRKRPHDPG